MSQLRSASFVLVEIRHNVTTGPAVEGDLSSASTEMALLHVRFQD